MLGISESRWNGVASLRLQRDEKVVYVGDDEVHQVGVAITMSARANRAMVEWAPISKEITKPLF